MPNRAKPVEQKRLAGNPGKRPLPAPIAILPAQIEAPPAPKGTGAVGKREWLRIWKQAGPWIADTDLPVVTMYCQACDEREKLRRVLRKEGLFTTGSMGQTVSHPAVSQMRTLERLMTTWLSLCGFTPSDRSRLGLSELRRESELDSFLTRRGQGRVVEAG